VGAPVGERVGLGVGERVGDSVAGPARTAAGSQRAQPTHADVRAACISHAPLCVVIACIRMLCPACVHASARAPTHMWTTDYGVCAGRLYSSGQDSARAPCRTGQCRIGRSDRDGRSARTDALARTLDDLDGQSADESTVVPNLPAGRLVRAGRRGAGAEEPSKLGRVIRADVPRT
jgi:hypothetical protein